MYGGPSMRFRENGQWFVDTPCVLVSIVTCGLTLMY